MRLSAADRWRRVEEICQAALDRAAPERSSFVVAACEGDEELRREVEAIVGHTDRAAGFLSEPISAVAAAALREEAVSLIGRRVGSYHIQSSLGAGGMGEVYRAHDTELGREVAIKVLPPAFVADRDRLARFEREARVLAALNHPNIAAIYGVVPVDAGRALVLELVDGETLAERISAHPSGLAVGETLGIARQIAEALEAAHEKGIVHRDVKPANIKLTPTGIVKVLDFGLAKGGEESAPHASQSPTLTAGGTREGMLLGTAAYMSPEQARGQSVDQRADIWAFGCVLFEMLTGHMAFPGHTVSDHIASILEREPEWTTLPAATPPRIHRLLRRCLAKDLRRRLPDVAVARLEIDDPLDETGSTANSIRQSRTWMQITTAALLVIGLVLLAAVGLIRRDHRNDSIALDLGPPDGYRFLGLPGTVAISPDGQHVVFPVVPTDAGPSASELGIDATGLRRADGALLNIRDFTSPTARPLAGTEGGTFPFWSPDGRFVGFVSDGVLKKISVTDGSVMQLADGASGRATWSAASIILFTGSDGRLRRVADNGGATTIASELDKSRGEYSHAWPVFLPDGRRFIYVARSNEAAMSAVYLSTIDSTARTRLMGAVTSVEYASGYLLYERSGSLIAQRFDDAAAQLTGGPRLIIGSIATGGAYSSVAVSVSQNGVMVYRRGPSRSVIGGLGELTWFDRSGDKSKAITPPGYYRYASLSPDGRRVAVMFSADGRSFDVWQVDLERNVPTRFTFNGDDDFWPVAWTRDAKYVAFASRHQPGRAYDLYRRLADGASADELLYESPDPKHPTGFSPDGKILLFTRDTGPPKNADVWALPIDAPRDPFPVVSTPFNEGSAVFSPDGRWIAYVSDDTGAMQVYVEPFPPTGSRFRLSTTGGTSPMWTRGGREVVYATTEQEFMAVDVTVAGPAIRVSAPQHLFAHPHIGGNWNHFAVDSAGDQFLLTVPQKDTYGAMTVVLNWPSLLQK
jgi:serine/threonine protein kinase/Tol biopolymer transport system component